MISNIVYDYRHVSKMEACVLPKDDVEKLLKAGVPLAEVMKRCDVKPEDLEGWEDVVIDESTDMSGPFETLADLMKALNDE